MFDTNDKLLFSSLICGVFSLISTLIHLALIGFKVVMSTTLGWVIVFSPVCIGLILDVIVLIRMMVNKE